MPGQSRATPHNHAIYHACIERASTVDLTSRKDDYCRAGCTLGETRLDTHIDLKQLALQSVCISSTRQEARGRRRQMTARAEARTVVCAEAVLQWVLRVARVTEAGMRVAIWMVERAAVAAPEERVVRARSTRCSRRRPRTHCTWCATDCCWPSTRCHTGEAKALAEARAARAMRAARVAPQA
eukprot:1672870-Prymnesium_polylepis.1